MRSTTLASSKHCFQTLALIAVLGSHACASTPNSEKNGPPTAAPTVDRIALDVSLDPTLKGGTGTLVVWWETEEERTTKSGLGDALNRRLKRAEVFDDVTLEAGVVRTVEVLRPQTTVPVVWHLLHDVHHRYWDTAFGQATSNPTLTSDAAIIDQEQKNVALVLDQQRVASDAPKTEPCSGDGLQLVTFRVPQVVGKVGNNPERRLCVSLPPTYDDTSATQHPVVFMLPGLHSNHMSKLRGKSDLRPVRDALFPSAILVGVDGSTRLGSTYFTTSAVSGDWNVFLDQMVATIDAAFATNATPRARFLIGQSTGGFNAIALAMRRQDLFGGAAASAPDGLDMERWLEGAEADGQMASPWYEWMRLEARLTGPIAPEAPVQWGQLVSYAADFSPNLEATPPWDWPADLATGRLDPEVVARWQQLSPAGMLDVDETLDSVRTHLAGRLFIAVGRNDEFDLFAPAEQFSKKMTALNVDHVFVATDEGHFESTERLRQGIAFLAQLPTGEGTAKAMD